MKGANPYTIPREAKAMPELINKRVGINIDTKMKLMEWLINTTINGYMPWTLAQKAGLISIRNCAKTEKFSNTWFPDNSQIDRVWDVWNPITTCRSSNNFVLSYSLGDRVRPTSDANTSSTWFFSSQVSHRNGHGLLQHSDEFPLINPRSDVIATDLEGRYPPVNSHNGKSHFLMCKSTIYDYKWPFSIVM